MAGAAFVGQVYELGNSCAANRKKFAASAFSMSIGSAQPPTALAEPPLAPQCSPCNGYRICISPMFCVTLAIVMVNYFPYVVWTPHTCLLDYARLVVFHLLLLLLLASYMQTVFTDPGTVPSEWHAAVARDPLLAAQHRLCSKSKLYRPLRSHYCSVTRRVVLNMDHFCPWVVNTVGFYNRKYFVQFLFYTFFTCGWVLLTSLHHLPLIAVLKGSPIILPSVRKLGWSGRQVMLLILVQMIDLALVLMLSCFATFHLRMVLKNEASLAPLVQFVTIPFSPFITATIPPQFHAQTTIEGPSPIYNLGTSRNCWQVCGRKPLYWFLPVWGDGPDGDGVHWPVHAVWIDEETGLPCSPEQSGTPAESDQTMLFPGRPMTASSDSSVEEFDVDEGSEHSDEFS